MSSSVQRCMDEVETANMFGDRISFLVVDVQHCSQMALPRNKGG